VGEWVGGSVGWEFCFVRVSRSVSGFMGWSL